jgi:hypothetical protein
MPGSGSWDVIFGADSDQIVLGVDFPVTKRREAGFADLAAKIGPKYSFLQTRLPAWQASQPASGAAHVDQWVDDIRDRPVTAVLGYRVGSVYAAAIAEGLIRWQRPPRVILFDPQLAGIGLLCQELHREIGVISSLLSDDEIERAGKLAAGIAESDPGDVAGTAAAVTGIYREVSSAAFERAGLGSAYCSTSSAPFESYISLISAACQIDPSRAWKRSAAILSSDYASLPGSPSLTGDTSGPIGRSIPLGVSHADLLCSDCVAEAVLGLLEF